MMNGAVARAVKGDLRNRGFAVVEDLYSKEDVDEVLTIMTSLFDRHGEIEQLDRGRGKPMAGDVLFDGRPGQKMPQPEIIFPTLFEPKLLETPLYRKCSDFIRAMYPMRSLRFDHTILKPAGSNRETHWHQDRAYSAYTGRIPGMSLIRIHLWIPLQDATADNGCLEFLPGSHRWGLLKHEMITKPNGATSLQMVLPEGAAPFCAEVPVGGMTMHDFSTVHRGRPNISDQNRMAWILQFSIGGGIERRMMTGSARPH